ncbi:hypothetical protein HaLaN_17665 [Haematococcus lacustris]|uniref:Uncharacterized protein n=1 Tax=Haematococcus lacustris TaxID=44745 RepID=A0A699ZCW3_HAELA|nr:hypothetical protein HaLaN_17665 [Haematococcus lacustris]
MCRGVLDGGSTRRVERLRQSGVMLALTASLATHALSSCLAGLVGSGGGKGLVYCPQAPPPSPATQAPGPSQPLTAWGGASGREGRCGVGSQAKAGWRGNERLHCVPAVAPMYIHCHGGMHANHHGGVDLLADAGAAYKANSIKLAQHRTDQAAQGGNVEQIRLGVLNTSAACDCEARPPAVLTSCCSIVCVAHIVHNAILGWFGGVADGSELRAARSSQTAPAMSQRDTLHQAAMDGGASATDGYSPAGQAPPPATRLLDLPPALLDDIACRVMQLGARSLLPLTCRAFSQARLLHVPALRIQLGRQCCDQLLTPRVVAALQLPQTEDTQDYTNLLDHALAKLDNCAAVEVCNLVSWGVYSHDKHRHLHCTPGLAQHLLDSFPSLTALTLRGLCVSSDALASLLSHPRLALQLQQLHLYIDSDTAGEEPGAVDPLFQGLQLKQLSIAADPEQPDSPPLPSFEPLAQHLTQLHLMVGCHYKAGLSFFRECLQPLAQLQALTISNHHGLEGLMEVLLQALPQLHTLQLPDATVLGQQQLDTLLAATQITSLQLSRVNALDTSYADAPCSWQRLELQWIDWEAITYLPLHSLTQPLVLGRVDIRVEDILDPKVAAALYLLANVLKVPVKNKDVRLTLMSPEQPKRLGVITPAFLQQQRVDLAQLVAVLQPLQCRGKLEVRYLHGVTAADVVALAPLCRDCTHFAVWEGSIEPSLEFWHQLVQLMPAVQKVVEFLCVKGSACAAMHESLQLMAEQPWARWLDIKVSAGGRPLPACCLDMNKVFSNPSQPGRIKAVRASEPAATCSQVSVMRLVGWQEGKASSVPAMIDLHAPQPCLSYCGLRWLGCIAGASCQGLSGLGCYLYISEGDGLGVGAVSQVICCTMHPCFERLQCLQPHHTASMKMRGRWRRAVSACLCTTHAPSPPPPPTAGTPRSNSRPATQVELGINPGVQFSAASRVQDEKSDQLPEQCPPQQPAVASTNPTQPPAPGSSQLSRHLPGGQPAAHHHHHGHLGCSVGGVPVPQVLAAAAEAVRSPRSSTRWWKSPCSTTSVSSNWWCSSAQLASAPGEDEVLMSCCEPAARWCAGPGA